MHCAVFGSILLMAAVACGSETRYVATREVALAYATANDAPVNQVDVWVTRDGGKTWAPAPVENCGRLAVCFQAPEDGWYGFYLVLHNAAGASAEAPGSGAEPQCRVVVDTAPPVLQIHGGAGPLRVAAGSPLNIRLSLIDEHLGSRPVRVFSRAGPEAPWIDRGQASVEGIELTWPVPEDLAEPVELRIVATDLAGNRAVEDLPNVVLDAPSSRPAAPQLTAPSAEESRSPTAQPLDFGQLERLKELRSLAVRHSANGRYSQAVDTLERGLQMCPNDPDLLADLGEAMYGAGRHDEADRQFSTAVAKAPDHTRALEGLALVAATQKRYSQAAAHLEHLLRLKPDSAETWLHYGDVEHKLGEPARALEAWERVVSLRDADPAACESAERRLKYFGSPSRARP